MSDILTHLLISEFFIPHGHCYLWKPSLVWFHIISDGVISLSYYSIPLTLFYFVRQRRDLPFSWIFLLFGVFIVSCGTTHILEIWTLWHPTYWLSGSVKAITAIASLFTALQLIPLVPQALALPSPAQLEQTNQELQTQIQQRQKIEADLRQSQNQLEQRVQERTAELLKINLQLQQEVHDRIQAERDRERLLKQEQAARESAEQANRIKDEFLAVLSHELRTPLNPILGWLNLLQRGQLSATQTVHAFNTIERNAKLQAQLIDDLLDISRILQGKLHLAIAPVDLKQVITAALETVRLAAEAKALHVETAIAPEKGSVQGDAGRLQQVVWNLLSNAIKFTPTGGRITIALEYRQGNAQIQVTDTGVGIAPHFLPYVFEHFRQADGATTRKFGGLGLGLAIVRQIVELHGGIVTAESQGEGQGSRFTVQIPLAAQPDPDLSSESVPPVLSVLTQSHILVVDDDPDSREFTTFLLEQAGSRVTAVDSGDAALRSLQQSAPDRPDLPDLPDLIVSDIGMPHMDGYQFLQQVRSLDSFQQVPAIALTAYAGEFDRQQAIAAGFQLHLPKPIQPETLLTAIAALLQQHCPVVVHPSPQPSHRALQD